MPTPEFIAELHAQHQTNLAALRRLQESDPHLFAMNSAMISPSPVEDGGPGMTSLNSTRGSGPHADEEREAWAQQGLGRYDNGCEEGVSPRRARSQVPTSLHSSSAAVEYGEEALYKGPKPPGYHHEATRGTEERIYRESAEDPYSDIRDYLRHISEVVHRIDDTVSLQHPDAIHSNTVAELRRALRDVECERDAIKRYASSKEDAIIVLSRQLQSVTNELTSAKETIGQLRARIHLLEVSTGTSGHRAGHPNYLPSAARSGPEGSSTRSPRRIF